MMTNKLSLENYPRTKKFLEITGMTLDQALIFTENELNKLKKEVNHTILPVSHNARRSGSNPSPQSRKS